MGNENYSAELGDVITTARSLCDTRYDGELLGEMLFGMTLADNGITPNDFSLSVPEGTFLTLLDIARKAMENPQDEEAFSTFIASIAQLRPSEAPAADSTTNMNVI